MRSGAWPSRKRSHPVMKLSKSMTKGRPLDLLLVALGAADEPLVGLGIVFDVVLEAGRATDI